MAKRITAKVDTYEKDGETKGKYVEIGVILSGQHGDYILLNPTVNLAGVLVQQRMLNPSKASKSVICNIFDDSQQQQQRPAPAAKAPAQPEFDDDIPF